MKQGHLLLVFIFVYFSCFLSLHYEQKNYDDVMEEKQRIEHALLEAAEYTAYRYRGVIKDSEEQKKKRIEEAFSEAFYFITGETPSMEPEGFWRIYIPMIILVEEDGAYFYYLKENTGIGNQRLVHEWTDKYLFDISETHTNDEKRAIMANVLEDRASQIITNHNFIAKQYGISFSYSLPAFFQDITQSPEFPMIFVVFQGWPLNPSETIFYENCVDAGVFLREKTE